jgi:hypothetical protein
MGWINSNYDRTGYAQKSSSTDLMDLSRLTADDSDASYTG